MHITKAQYVGRQMRRGRSRAQAEGTWKMMQAQKKAMSGYYALNAKTYKRGIIIEATMDKYANVTLRPKSERVRKQIVAHNLENVGTGYDHVYLQREDDIHTLKQELTTAQQHELYEGYPVCFKMDPWIFGHYVGHDFHEVIRPNPEHRYSYGELPPKRVFMSAYKASMAGEPSYHMLLRGPDARAAKGTTFARAINQDVTVDDEELWLGVKQLHKKWERGNEEAGDLASAILYTIDIEWI